MKRTRTPRARMCAMNADADGSVAFHTVHPVHGSTATPGGTLGTPRGYESCLERE